MSLTNAVFRAIAFDFLRFCTTSWMHRVACGSTSTTLCAVHYLGSAEATISGHTTAEMEIQCLHAQKKVFPNQVLVLVKNRAALSVLSMQDVREHFSGKMP